MKILMQRHWGRWIAIVLAGIVGVACAFEPGNHAATFGGNYLACAQIPPKARSGPTTRASSAGERFGL